LRVMHCTRSNSEGVHRDTVLPDLGVGDEHNSMKWAER
jgi:hypothetical protein